MAKEGREGGDGRSAVRTAAASAPPRGGSAFEDDHYLVGRLISLDEAAWDFVVGDRIFPALEHSAKWSDMLRRMCIERNAVATEVFLSLTADDCRNLRKFRFENAFSSYLYDWMRAAMKTIVRMCGKEIPKDLSDYEGDAALTGQRQPSPRRRTAAREALEEFNVHLATLWNVNPVHALVLLMRDTEGLSAKEVAEMIGVSPANVDQMHKRARTRLEALCGKGGSNVLD